MQSKMRRMYFHRRLRIALIKNQIIVFLGGKCVACNKRNWKILQIDHVNGKGSSISRGESYWRSVLEEIKRGSKDYQLLCSDCNYLKELEKHEHNRKYVDIPSIFELQELLGTQTPEEIREQFLAIKPRFRNKNFLCSKCQRYLPRESFSPSKRNRFGIRCICKECRRIKDEG